MIELSKNNSVRLIDGENYREMQPFEVPIWKDCIHTVFNQEKTRKQMEATTRMLLCVKTANVGIVVIN